MMPPCGVPASFSRQLPSSTAPALSQRLIVLVNVGSFASSGPWATLSNEDLS